MARNELKLSHASETSPAIKSEISHRLSFPILSSRKNEVKGGRVPEIKAGYKAEVKGSKKPELVSNRKAETANGFQVFDLPCIRVSAKGLATKYKVDYPTAQGFIKFLVARGLAEEVGKVRAARQGKPTTIYLVPTQLAMNLKAA